jgi:predicted Zn-dependent peptidase
MGKSLIAFGEVSSDSKNRQAIEAVTSERIREAARTVFNPEVLSTLIYL